MEKLKIYLDTSFISHLDASDAPELMKATLEVWGFLKSNPNYEMVLSGLTLQEVSDCSEPKRSVMRNKIAERRFLLLPESEDVIQLADSYLKMEVLTKKSRPDLLHIAYAVSNHCDFILSWNFKHFVREKTIAGLRNANRTLNRDQIEILSPATFLERVNNNEILE